jgi:hypothetical protein
MIHRARKGAHVVSALVRQHVPARQHGRDTSLANMLDTRDFFGTCVD